MINVYQKKNNTYMSFGNFGKPVAKSSNIQKGGRRIDVVLRPPFLYFIHQVQNTLVVSTSID